MSSNMKREDIFMAAVKSKPASHPKGSSSSNAPNPNMNPVNDQEPLEVQKDPMKSDSKLDALNADFDGNPVAKNSHHVTFMDTGSNQPTSRNKKNDSIKPMVAFGTGFLPKMRIVKATNDSTTNADGSDSARNPQSSRGKSIIVQKPLDKESPMTSPKSVRESETNRSTTSRSDMKKSEKAAPATTKSQGTATTKDTPRKRNWSKVQSRYKFWDDPEYSARATELKNKKSKNENTATEAITTVAETDSVVPGVTQYDVGIQTNEPEILNNSLITGEYKEMRPSVHLRLAIDHKRDEEKKQKMLKMQRKYPEYLRGEEENITNLKEFLDHNKVSKRITSAMPTNEVEDTIHPKITPSTTLKRIPEKRFFNIKTLVKMKEQELLQTYKRN